MPVTYRKTGNPEAPVVICVDGNETPVWMQEIWNTGPDAQYIRMNGCGHCCAAMAARLQGVKDIDPEIEYARCKELWGEPCGPQDHFQTVRGIVNVLKSFGVKAEALGVPQGQWSSAETPCFDRNPEAASGKTSPAAESAEAATGPETGPARGPATGPARGSTTGPTTGSETDSGNKICKFKNRLEQELKDGRQVIFWSHPMPGGENENPFSRYEHYVMACGYDETGNIVIANSGGDGVQFVDMNTVMSTLYFGTEPIIETWGEEACLEKCGGVVIVG